MKIKVAITARTDAANLDRADGFLPLGLEISRFVRGNRHEIDASHDQLVAIMFALQEASINTFAVQTEEL